MFPSPSAIQCARVLAFVLLALLAAAPAARAHRVTVFAWVDGDTVHTESKFGGGRRAKNAAITVYDGSDRRLLAGRTDENGEFSFPVPAATALRIVLNAGMGHRAEWRIEEAEIRQGLAAAGGTRTGQSASPTPPPGHAENDRTPPAPPPPTSTGPDAAEVERIVERALDRKLRPVMALLAEKIDPGPTIGDVLGGLGYILGLVGLAAYLNARRRRPNGDR